MVLRLECGDGSGWDCVEEVTHATLSAFFILRDFFTSSIAQCVSCKNLTLTPC